MKSLIALVVALVALALVRPAVTLAQDATPVASPAAGGTCTVEPRPTDELLALWFGPEGTPLATPRPASPVAGEAALPEGEAADEETVAAVNATLQELAACLATNQFARAFALTTDDLVRKFGPPPGATPKQLRNLLEAQLRATPEPVGEPVEVLSLRDVRVLDDDRVGGLLADEDGQPAFVVFEPQAGRWLIADFIEARPARGTPAVGTPVTVGDAAAEATPA